MRERRYSGECLLGKKMKAERSRLIPRNHTENLVLLTAYCELYFVYPGHLQRERERPDMERK